MHTGSDLRVNRSWAGGALVMVIGFGLVNGGLGGCSVDSKGLNVNADGASADAAVDRGAGTGGRGGSGGLGPIGTGGGVAPGSGAAPGSGGRVGASSGGGPGLGSGGDTVVGTGGGNLGTGGDVDMGTGGAGTGGAGTGGAATGGAATGGTGTGGAGTGGRMGTGGDGAMGCNANTCPNGCCNGATCVTNRTNQRCGTAGAACAPCGACYQCSGNTGSCALTPSARWDLLCASATIPPTKPGNVVWDSTTGQGTPALPDPYCEFALESSGPGTGQQGRTSVRMDTLSPIWNQSVVPTFGANITHNVLTAQPTRWSVSVTDDDGSATSNDLLCTFSPRLTAADFAAGAVTLSGQSCLSLTIHLVCAEN